ncbi:fungal-specific transcription factor domain-containing protein [Aspergillus granulosus]|uniref:Fungal-specific transcription factor domain-containing protein n=1 Tax=Aspergillus granulosus TaxID=176169 RepID=A0ABR4GS21_9EURO
MPSPQPCKRQRICRACDQCRRRKSKCDGTQPACKICTAAGRRCSYQHGGGRRGLPTGYVRGLEIALGLIFQHVSNSQDTLSKLLRDPQTDRNLALEVWRKSKVSSQVANLTYPIPIDGVISEAETMLSYGDWGEPDRRDIQTKPPAASIEPSAVPLADLQPLQPLPIVSVRPEQVGNSPLPPDTTNLIDIYFAHTHSWFPIIERRDLLRAMHTYPGDYPSHDPSHLLLWAVCAYASFISGRQDDSLPTSLQILYPIQLEVLGGTVSPKLAHIQALAILILFQLGKGDVHSAWILSGQAIRMMLLVQSSGQSRFRNTFHGCAFLDSVIASVLDKTPSLSVEEHIDCDLVDEDGLEEWDSWSIPSQSAQPQQRTAPKGPLHSLSAFNQLQRLARVLSQILYCPPDTSTRHQILSEIQVTRNTIEDIYPYHGLDSATPPILAVHLMGSFTILSALHRFELEDSGAVGLGVATSHRMFDLLRDYITMAGAVNSSPLPAVFALQCQRYLENMGSSVDVSVLMAVKNRLSEYQQWVSLYGIPGSGKDATNSIFAFTGNGGLDTTGYQSPGILPLGESEALPPTTTTINETPQSSGPGSGRASYVTPISTIPENPPPSSSRSPVFAPDTDNFDELFEELMTSIPKTGLEPSFAHNLGFYAGDLDTDFLTQLQQPPEG